MRIQLLHFIVSKILVKNVTIISEDCISGAIYQFLGKPYLSPTIGLWISCNDYLKFVSNIAELHKHTISFEPNSGFNYPVGVINGIRIGFQHYNSKNEVLIKWDRRIKRIKLDELFVKIDFRYEWYDKKDFDQWNSSQYKNSIAIINDEVFSKFGNVHNSVKINENLDYNTTRKELMKRIVFWKWLKKGELKKPKGVERIVINLLIKLYYW